MLKEYSVTQTYLWPTNKRKMPDKDMSVYDRHKGNRPVNQKYYSNEKAIKQQQ